MVCTAVELWLFAAVHHCEGQTKSILGTADIPCFWPNSVSAVFTQKYHCINDNYCIIIVFNELEYY